MQASVLIQLLIAGATTALGPALHAPCPTDCICDLSGMPRRVDCAGRNLNDFPTDIHPSTQHLDLSHNHISALPPRLSHLAPQLETIILKNNSISAIPDDLFRGLPDLRSADLSFNQLNTPFSAKIFSTNSRIFDFTLSGNLNLTLFTGLISSGLEILDLSLCGISSVAGDAFSGLTALRSLNLSFNPLNEFPEKLAIKTLRLLDVSSCNMTKLAANSLAALPNIQQLQISRNKNLELPQDAPLQSKSLLELAADHCDIKSLALSQMPSLTHGYFSCNKITGVKKGNFAKKSSLLEIDLSHNLIRELPPDLFMNAKQLVSVDLSSNRIESIQHDLFECCTNLQFLNLSRNDITSLPDILTMPSLVIFDLSRCRLQNLPTGSKFLSRMSKLNTLYLTHNELQSIPALKSGSLRSLDLSYCHLKQVTHSNFRNLSKLHKINLSGNRMTSMNASIFRDNKNLGSLFLDDNPWFCNCTDPEFIKLWELTERLSEGSRNTLRCQDPDEVSGLLWEEACGQSLPATSARDNTVLLTVILVACVGTIVAAVMCSKRALHSGRKPSVTGGRRRRNQSERGERTSSDEDSDDAVSVRVPRARVRSEDTRQCTPCNDRENQVARAAAELPPTYEEAVMLAASSVSVAIIDPVTSAAEGSDTESASESETTGREPTVSEL